PPGHEAPRRPEFERRERCRGVDRQRGDQADYGGSRRPAGAGAAGEPVAPPRRSAQRAAGEKNPTRAGGMIDRIISSLVALSLASLIWLYVRSRDLDTLDNVPVPVQITLASGLTEQYDFDLPDPCHIMASFTGPPSR